jgi:hypothetical protein
MDFHPAAVNNNFRIPTDIGKFSGDGTTSPDEFLNELDNWYHILSTPPHIRPRISALFLAGAAKEWYYNDYVTLLPGQQTYELFQSKLRARFARGDENVIARRLQPTFRIIHTDPPNFIQSVGDFNAAFTRNQVKVKGQGKLDAYMAYIECIRCSAADYPEVLQVLQPLSTLPDDEHTLERAQELVAKQAPNVIDTHTHTPHQDRHHNHPPSTLHAINSYPTSPQRFGGVKRSRTQDGRMSHQEARRLKICTYCRNPQADHRTVRAYNHATGKMDGDIICPVCNDRAARLISDIAIKR